MSLRLPLKKRIAEKEEAVLPETFIKPKAYNSLQNFKGIKTVNIIPEDNKNSVKSASWAYGDHVLEDLMFGKNFMKCIILADSFHSQMEEVIGTDGKAGICGVCIDHGGDNYIVFPIMQTNKNNVESFKMCSNSNFQSYLSH